MSPTKPILITGVLLEMISALAKKSYKKPEFYLKYLIENEYLKKF
jgi:hypothetical protein